MQKSVWVVGAGYMGEEYLKVLVKSKVAPFLIGNSCEKTEALARKYKVSYSVGGYESSDQGGPSPDFVILACPIEKLFDAAKYFINKGVKHILCEKPVSFHMDEIRELSDLAKRQGASVSVAYNRRYYSSVQQGLEIIRQDGGVESAFFDFTEWEAHYNSDKNSPDKKKNWLIANSTHLIDLAFFIIGKPHTLSTLKLDKSDRIFIGQGISEKNVPFSYHSNWLSAGRWGIEIFTCRRKIIWRPLEKLQFQMRNSLSVEIVEPDLIDTEYKPGIFRMIDCFLDNKQDELISLEEHLEHFKHYIRIQKNV